MFQIEEFKPDLIIEVTNVCNKNCKGCYASNVDLNSGKESNLSPELLNLSLQSLLILEELNTISIRGGEPTLNQDIDKIILRLEKFSFDKIYLETNGDWIQENSPLLLKLENSKVIIKLSTDKMHAIPAQIITKRVDLLKKYKLNFLLAVTDESLEKCIEFVTEHYPNVNAPFIFQKKAYSTNELIQPTYGVLNSKGVLSKTLTTKFKI